MNGGNVRNPFPEESDEAPATQPAMKRSAPRNARVRVGTHDGSIIVVYSLSGGTGKTTIATNIAVSLKRPGERVLLVDCALQAGDVGVFLNIQAQNSLSDLLQDVEHLLPEIADPDSELSGDILVKHRSGVEVLLAPPYRQDAKPIVVDSFTRLLERLRNCFDFIVLDMASNWDELNIALLDLADHVLLVVNPTLSSIKNTRVTLALFDTLPWSADKVQLVFNQVDGALERRKAAIPMKAIEANLRRQALGVIPRHDERVLSAINRGTPVTDWYTAESPAKDLIALADALYALCRGSGQSVT
jgi:pilus assembly protein CpaE